MKVKAEQCIEDFEATLRKVPIKLSQFLRYELRLFTSKTYPNFVTMDQFLLHF